MGWLQGGVVGSRALPAVSLHYVPRCALSFSFSQSHGFTPPLAKQGLPARHGLLRGPDGEPARQPVGAGPPLRQPLLLLGARLGGCPNGWAAALMAVPAAGAAATCAATCHFQRCSNLFCSGCAAGRLLLLLPMGARGMQPLQEPPTRCSSCHAPHPSHLAPPASSAPSLEPTAAPPPAPRRRMCSTSSWARCLAARCWRSCAPSWRTPPTSGAAGPPWGRLAGCVQACRMHDASAGCERFAGCRRAAGRGASPAAQRAPLMAAAGAARLLARRSALGSAIPAASNFFM